MKKRIAIAAATILGVIASMFVAVQPAQAAVGIRVSNGRLVEANGTPLILRGINHAHTWFPTQTSSFADIKAAGANAVRVVLSGGRWQPANGASDVANVINLCKTNRLICVLENHDTTGFGEQSGAVSLDAAVNYWISVQSALTGQENYVILNIGNEPIGNNAVTPAWPQATSSAITRLRNAGFQHTIMVDAPNWGQDWAFVMRDNAPSVLAADPTGNTIFSVHMYGVYDTAAEITSYINSFTSRNLALCVCEFGFNHSDGNPDEDTIMSATQAAGIGNMGWSWSGNGGGVEYLDMVTNFNPAQRSSWGTRYITGANGLSTTSREATIFGGGSGGDTTPPTAPGTPTASNVTASAASLSWSASTDSGGSGLAGYNVYREQGATDQLLGQSSTNSITLTGLSASTQYQVYVRARDGAGNLSGNSALATFTTSGGGGGGGCQVAYTANSWGSGSGGYTASITITNTGTAAVNGWTLRFPLPSGQGFSQGWSATWTPSGQNLSAANVSWNASIAPGANVGIGFNGTWTGSFSEPTAFTLNNAACTVV